MLSESLKDLRILVTAGPTRERLDPVRYISNFSSGKMGYSIAAEAIARGARVTLVTGPVAIAPPEGAEVVYIESTRDLLEAVSARAVDCDIVIQAAAPADYRPAEVSPIKMKKHGGDDMVLRLVENPDVAATIGAGKKPGQVFVVFAAETNDAFENASGKMHRKNADMAVLNDVTQPGAGFNTDTNIVTIITPEGRTDYGIMPKPQVAGVILDAAKAIYDAKNA